MCLGTVDKADLQICTGENGRKGEERQEKNGGGWAVGRETASCFVSCPITRCIHAMPQLKNPLSTKDQKGMSPSMGGHPICPLLTPAAG